MHMSYEVKWKDLRLDWMARYLVTVVKETQNWIIWCVAAGRWGRRKDVGRGYPIILLRGTQFMLTHTLSPRFREKEPGSSVCSLVMKMHCNCTDHCDCGHCNSGCYYRTYSLINNSLLEENIRSLMDPRFSFSFFKNYSAVSLIWNTFLPCHTYALGEHILTQLLLNQP